MAGTLVRLTRRYTTPGGALYLPGEILSVSAAVADELLRLGAAEAATQTTSEKAPDGPPHDKMVAVAPRKKERHG